MNDVSRLATKEGLALLNGTPASTAFFLKGLFCAENALNCSVAIGSLSVEAALSSRVLFDERIHELRGHQAQIDVAAAYRGLLKE